MMHFQRMDFVPGEWDRSLEEYPDRHLFQSAAWISFLQETQRGEPVVAELKDAGRTVGLFAGLIVRRFGFRILGSPFPGWTTPIMGIRLREGVRGDDAGAALIRFAFGELGCHHLEIRDSSLDPGDAARSAFDKTSSRTLEIDLSQSEEQLFAAMKGACRRCIRKAEKQDVTIEEAHDPEFADDYYRQIQDVFSKQALIVPLMLPSNKYGRPTWFGSACRVNNWVPPLATEMDSTSTSSVSGRVSSATQSSDDEYGGVPRVRFPPPDTCEVLPSKEPVRGSNQRNANWPVAPDRSKTPVLEARGK